MDALREKSPFEYQGANNLGYNGRRARTEALTELSRYGATQDVRDGAKALKEAWERDQSNPGQHKMQEGVGVKSQHALRMEAAARQGIKPYRPPGL